MLYFLLFGFVLWQNSFFPHFCVTIYAVQKYYPNTSISIILSTTTTVTTQSTASTTSISPTSTDQYNSLSLPTRYVKAAGIGAFHSTLKSESNALYWTACKQRVAFESNALTKALLLLAGYAARCFLKQRVVTIRNDPLGLLYPSLKLGLYSSVYGQLGYACDALFIYLFIYLLLGGRRGDSHSTLYTSHPQ